MDREFLRLANPIDSVLRLDLKLDIPIWIHKDHMVSTNSMADQRNILWDFKPDDSTPRYVTGIGYTQLLTEGQGDVKATTMINGAEVPITIKNVLFVPKLGTNLFSIGASTNEGVEAVFTNNEA